MADGGQKDGEAPVLGSSDNPMVIVRDQKEEGWGPGDVWARVRDEEDAQYAKLDTYSLLFRRDGSIEPQGDIAPENFAHLRKLLTHLKKYVPLDF